jgi:hypothetical protein
MFVKPAPGLKVRDPATHVLLPDEGREVPDNTDWARMLAQGDVVLADPPDPPDPPPEEEAPEQSAEKEGDAS